MKDRYLNIKLGNLLVMKWKAEETKENIEAGKLSYSKNMPVLVSYVPDERKYIILDGHHRAIELAKEGVKELCCLISIHKPKTWAIDYPYITLKKLTL